MSTTARVSLRRRLAAWFALARHGGARRARHRDPVPPRREHRSSGSSGLFLAVAGGWWLVTEPMPRRAIGIAGLVAGVALIVVAIANALDDADRIASRSVLIAALLAITLACARARDAARPPPDRRPRTRRAVRLGTRSCSATRGPAAGRSSSSVSSSLARELGVETVMLDRGLDLEQLARDAVARGADCLGMAGGDGSQALVASIAVEHGLPFVCVSAGHATTSRSTSGSTATIPANRCTPSATRWNARSTTPP